MRKRSGSNPQDEDEGQTQAVESQRSKVISL
jgi:hypothetical protein